MIKNILMMIIMIINTRVNQKSCNIFALALLAELIEYADCISAEG